MKERFNGHLMEFGHELKNVCEFRIILDFIILSIFFQVHVESDFIGINLQSNIKGNHEWRKIFYTFPKFHSIAPII